MATERRPARPSAAGAPSEKRAGRPSTRIGPKPETRVGTKPTTQRGAKPDPHGGKQATARTSRGVASSKKNNTPLIIGGAVGGVILLIVIIAVAASGGSKGEEKKEEKTSKSSGSSGPTGPKVDENLLKQGMHKCNQGREMVQSLKPRIDARRTMSEAQLAELRKDLEKAGAMLDEGMNDIERSNGKEHMNDYINAKAQVRSYLKELSGK